MQVIRIMLRIGPKAVLDGTLARETAPERDRNRVIANIARREGLRP